MSIVEFRDRAGSSSNITFTDPPHRAAASYERELFRLRRALAQGAAQVRQNNELIQRQDILGKESDHRLLNGLQIVASLLSLQSRSVTNVEAASQLAAAAKRVAMIERVHRRLHSFDGAQNVPFRRYLEDLCGDFSTMLSSEENPEQVIAVEGTEIELPNRTAIPLGFIASELITNAVKYGKGRIAVRLEPDSAKGYALSVSNDGPALPEGFNPGACKGLGMRIIRSFVGQIGGELRFGRGDNDQGARFRVLFS
jgi:two-component system, sensor histidine kinase PdtaS